MANGYLAHFGVKGQRWGVRRYQNEDGTLTAAGKKRYLKTVSGKSKDEIITDLKNSGYKDVLRRAEYANNEFIKAADIYDNNLRAAYSKYAKDRFLIKNRARSLAYEMEHDYDGLLSADVNNGSEETLREDIGMVIGYDAEANFEGTDDYKALSTIRKYCVQMEGEYRKSIVDLTDDLVKKVPVKKAYTEGYSYVMDKLYLDPEHKTTIDGLYNKPEGQEYQEFVSAVAEELINAINEGSIETYKSR